MPRTNNRAIKALLHSLPTITNLALIQGDFNLHSPAWDPNVSCSSKVADDLLAACTLANLSLVNDDSTLTWHHPTNKSSVLGLLFVADKLLGRHPCTFENNCTNWGASDHSIFQCHFGQKQGIPHSTYIRQESNKEIAFIADTKATFLCSNASPHDQVQECFDQLYTNLHTAWDKHSKVPRDHTNPTRWWTPECELTKQVFEDSQDSADLKIYRRTVQQARKTFFDEKVKMMMSSNCPWQGVKWTRPRCPPSFTTIHDPLGNNITDPDRLFNHMHKHFNSTAASGKINWDIINKLPNLPEQSCPPISVAEIMENLALTSNTSAPGGDHLTWRHLKLIFDDLPELTALANIFNVILDSGAWPSQLKEVDSIIIPKPKKERYNLPKAFCPIALLNTLGKLFTKILSKCLQFDGIAHDLFHLGQFRGISKHATTDVGIILMDIITSNRDQGLHTTVLALDITQFFPSMDHQVITVLLAKLGFNGKISSFISNFLHDCTTSYLWDGLTSSHNYSCDNSIPQDNPLSPVLSALYLSLTIKHLFPWGYDRFTNSLFFVDDGMLVCSSFSLDNNVAFLADLYQNFLTLLGAVGLTIEQTKLELKHFIAYDVHASQCTFALVRQPLLNYSWKGKEYSIPPVKIWRYLGFFFDSYLKFSHHIRHYTNKGFSMIWAFNMLGNSCGGLGPRQWVMCYNACMVPMLTYGPLLWYTLNGKGTLKNFRHMAHVQNFAVRWITGCFQGTPIGAMELLSGIPPLQLWCNLLIASYAARVMTLPDNHLLHRAWQIEPLLGQLHNFVPQTRPSRLPSNNPLTCINALSTVGEQFIKFHNICWLGNRVIDCHANRFLYLHLDTPCKGSDNFKAWLKGFSCWVTQMESSGAWMIYTDSGFWKERRLGAQASVITRVGQVIMEHVEWVLTASSFDAEIAALESAISWLCTHDDMVGSPVVHFLIDNKGVIQSFLKTHVQSSQMSATHINLLLLNLFQ